MPPKLLAKPDRANGVLPVNAAARANPAKAPTVRLKLEVRRLPPGLTLTEFESILGEEWKLGAGKIDWREYRQGKQKSPGKLPEQSRCYLHVTSELLVKEFEQRFLAVAAQFHDKAGTYRDPQLRNLPPTLAFAANQRVPVVNKQKTDNRQGTIDQDAEFIAFLEAETQPLSKPAAIDNANAESGKESKEPKAKSTPLIEDLREKKANKAKAAASKAAAKHGKTESKEPEKEGKGGKGDGKRVEQAAKDAAKVLNKQAAGRQVNDKRGGQNQQAEAKAVAPPSPAKGKRGAQKGTQQNAATPAQANGPGGAAAVNPQQGPAPQRGQRQRGNAEGIKKMLQKDLGIKPGKNAPIGPAAVAASTPASTNPTTPPAATPSQQPAAKATPQGPKATPTAPKAQAQAQQAPPKSTPAPAASTTKAYLKHANPSQGMTEMLIQQALGQYGDVSNVTIDPRKGTAIAMFKDQEGLKKALEAKRVPVGGKGASVEVLEFKDRGGQGGSSGGGGGGGGGGRGGGFRGGRGPGRANRGGGQANASAPTGGGGS